jgi:NADH-quinone oxidoreductase subunit M
VAGYSSVAQLGFITLGIFSLRAEGATGSVLQMVNHGLVVGAVFFVVAMLWERTGTEDLTRLGGMAMRAPVLAALFLIVALATLAMPGSANFTGEFYILLGVFQSKIVFAFVAAIGVALAAFYSIRLFQRTMHNRLPDGLVSREIGLRDGVVLVPVVACILALALYPGLITKRADTSVEGSVNAVTASHCGSGVYVNRSAGASSHACFTGFPAHHNGWTGYAPISAVSR